MTGDNGHLTIRTWWGSPIALCTIMQHNIERDPVLQSS